MARTLRRSRSSPIWVIGLGREIIRRPEAPRSWYYRGMKLLWWRKTEHPETPDDEALTDLSPKRATAYANHLRRLREGQDVEFEQLTANLRNKHF